MRSLRSPQVEAVDLEAFPHFAYVSPLAVRLSPGDALYVPRNHPHQVRSPPGARNVVVSFEFEPLQGIDHLWTAVERERVEATDRFLHGERLQFVEAADRRASMAHAHSLRCARPLPADAAAALPGHEDDHEYAAGHSAFVEQVEADVRDSSRDLRA